MKKNKNTEKREVGKEKELKNQETSLLIIGILY